MTSGSKQLEPQDAPAEKRVNLLGQSPSALVDLFAGLGEKPFRARQVLQWIHQRNVDSFSEMTDLSMDLRAQLGDIASLQLPEVISEQTSTDGTVKWLFESGAGQAVESVFIPEPERGTLCISSQVGCALDCAFCATGAQGFNRNLSCDEIIGQVMHANRHLPLRTSGKPAVTNVVFMGMGEPPGKLSQPGAGTGFTDFRLRLRLVTATHYSQYLGAGAANRKIG